MKSLKPGCYPAAVTPFDASGSIDSPGLARLLAWFEAEGCSGAVIGGTNGEGPSLSAVEKRDLLRDVMPVRGKLDLVLGVATASLSEAIWINRQAAKIGAAAALVMPPGYFRDVPESGIEDWFRALLDEADLPILIYNFPQRTGITIRADLLERLAEHPNLMGAKDSSGDPENIAAYAAALPGKSLFVGNETLLLDALQAGWSGTISGAANVIPRALSEIVRQWLAGGTSREQARIRFQIVLKAIQALRESPQPATNKAILARIGVLDSPRVRLPLQEISDVEPMMERMVGLIQRPTGSLA